MFHVSALASQWQQPVQTSTSLNIHRVPMWFTGRSFQVWLTCRDQSLMVWERRLGPVSGGKLYHCDIIYWDGKAGDGGPESGPCSSLWPPGWCVERHRRPGPWPALTVFLLLLPRCEEHPSLCPAWHSVYSHIHLSCPQSAAWIEMLRPWWMAFLITTQKQKESSTELEVIFSFFVCFFCLAAFSFSLIRGHSICVFSFLH